MKRAIYVVPFVALGILVQFLVHALIEVWYIGLLTTDFSKYGFGLSWNVWLLIHHILTVILFIGGALAGYFSGIYWWRIIYTRPPTQ